MDQNPTMTPDRYTEIFGPIHPLDRNPNWTDQANCKGMDPELFLPERGDNHTANQAKAICEGCPIKDDCLDYAVFHNCIGIWGGTSGRERRKMVSKHPRTINHYRLAPPRDDIKHGTYNGYAQHLRRRIEPCEACSKAATEYRRQKRQQRNAPDQPSTP